LYQPFEAGIFVPFHHLRDGPLDLRPGLAGLAASKRSPEFLGLMTRPPSQCQSTTDGNTQMTVDAPRRLGEDDCFGGGKHMSDNKDAPRSDGDAELEREILRERKFTLAEAIGRLAGPGAMKGESPIPRMQQAEIEIESWLRSHLADTGGTLQGVLHRHVKGSELLLNNFEQPLVVLAGYCQRVLDSEYLLEELVREADVEWGHVMGERPYFEREGSPHPDDPYTVESVRNALTELLKQLAVCGG
jgi:hypothetical protein